MRDYKQSPAASRSAGSASSHAQLDEARGRVGLVHEASAQAPLDTAGFAARIAELAHADRAHPAANRRGAAIAQEAVLAELAVAELAAQKATSRLVCDAGAVRARGDLRRRGREGGAMKRALLIAAVLAGLVAGAAPRQRRGEEKPQGAADARRSRDPQPRRPPKSEPVEADARSRGRRPTATSSQIEDADPRMRAQALRRLGDLRLAAGG